ncbi:MAG: hypothetical protein CMF49_02695 [Legionellales bacterium]|nr:hypothetical protein [Legionellales bacterium]|tara:strand:- start:398 stop:1558 length:1161 start_codon:yes stop_codon:yes gene_type:complete
MRKFISDFFKEEKEDIKRTRPAKLSSDLVRRVKKYNESGFFGKLTMTVISFGSILEDIKKVNGYNVKSKNFRKLFNMSVEAEKEVMERFDNYENKLFNHDSLNKQEYLYLEAEIKIEILEKKVTFDNLKKTLNKKLDDTFKRSNFSKMINQLREVTVDLPYKESSFKEYIDEVQGKQPNYSSFMEKFKANNKDDFDLLLKEICKNEQFYREKNKENHKRHNYKNHTRNTRNNHNGTSNHNDRRKHSNNNDRPEIYEEHANILEINLPCKEKAIEKAYKKLAKKYHPDKNKNNEYAESIMKQLNNAFSYFKENTQCKEYKYEWKRTEDAKKFLAEKDKIDNNMPINNQPKKIVNSLKRGFFAYKKDNKPKIKEVSHKQKRQYTFNNQ